MIVRSMLFGVGQVGAFRTVRELARRDVTVPRTRARFVATHRSSDLGVNRAAGATVLAQERNRDFNHQPTEPPIDLESS